MQLVSLIFEKDPRIRTTVLAIFYGSLRFSVNGRRYKGIYHNSGHYSISCSTERYIVTLRMRILYDWKITYYKKKQKAFGCLTYISYSSEFYIMLCLLKKLW